MSFGLNDEGFTLKRFNDIKSEIEDNIKAFYPDANLSPESVFGQIIGVFTKPQADVWEQMQKVYSSQNPSAARQASLDDLVQYNGLVRLSAQPSLVTIGLSGDDLTVVPQDTLVSASTTGEVFTLLNDTIITEIQQRNIYIKLDTYVESIDYIITLDAIVNTVASGTGGSVETVAQALADEINGNASNPATATKLFGGVVKIEAKISPFDTALNNNMSYYAFSDFVSVDKGAILVNANSITTIDTPVIGFDFVENFEAGDQGRGVESDAELRIRREQSLQIIGAGTLPAIVARMENDIINIDAVKGFENRTDLVDVEGRPPHSIEIVILGGSDQDIADKLWAVKGGGIETFGNVNGGVGIDITDSNGDIQTMHFSRPVNKYIWLEVIIDLYNEETFPSDGETQIKNQALAYGLSTQQVGLDVIQQRFFGSIFEVPGIEIIKISANFTNAPGDPAPPLNYNTVPISSSEIAVFDISRISVTIP